MSNEIDEQTPRTTRRHRWWQMARRLLAIVYDELFRTRAPTIAAAVAFYFLLALVPLLIIFSSVLGFLPFPNVFGQLLILMSSLVPPDAMALVNKIVSSVLSPNRGKLLSFGILGYLWASSGGFSALIEALDIAYDVPVERPWWRHRLQALLLTLTTGGLVAVSLLALIAGPEFGYFLAQILPMSDDFTRMWPVLRVVLTVTSFVAGNVLLYYLGPTSRQSLLSTLPGATVAVLGWFGGSFGLNFYLRHFSNYNAAYGSLGAVICLMLWMYVVSLATLIGAELNAELCKMCDPRLASERAAQKVKMPEAPVV